MENLISRASAISTLAVLRVLNLCHTTCSALVDDLKGYDVSLSTSTAVPPKGGVPASGPLAVMLERAMEEMFVPWLEGTRYLETESKNLIELYAGLLSRFTRYHVRQSCLSIAFLLNMQCQETVLKAKPNSVLDKVVNQLSSSSSAATSSSTAQAAAAAISKYANMFTSSSSSNTKIVSPTISTKAVLPAHRPLPNGTRSGAVTPVNRPGLQRADSVKDDLVNKGLEEKVWAADGGVTLEMAERMLKWHAEAVGRVMELSAGDVYVFSKPSGVNFDSKSSGKNALALSKVLAEAIGRSFIETALDSSVPRQQIIKYLVADRLCSSLARLDNVDSRLEPDLQTLAVLKPADLTCHLWQRYTTTALLPLVGPAAPIRKEMNTFNGHNVVRMEGKISAVLQRAIDSAFCLYIS